MSAGEVGSTAHVEAVRRGPCRSSGRGPLGVAGDEHPHALPPRSSRDDRRSRSSSAQPDVHLGPALGAPFPDRREGGDGRRAVASRWRTVGPCRGSTQEGQRDAGPAVVALRGRTWTGLMPRPPRSAAAPARSATSSRVGTVRPREVGGRPGEPQHPVVAPQGEPAGVEGAVDDDRGRAGQAVGRPAQDVAGHQPVDPHPPAAQRSAWAARAASHPRGDDGARLARLLGEGGPADRRDVDLQVDPVQERAGQPTGVGADVPGGAGAVRPLPEGHARTGRGWRPARGGSVRGSGRPGGRGR